MRMHICPRRSTESYATVAFGLLCLAPVAVWLNLSDEEIGVRPAGHARADRRMRRLRGARSDALVESQQPCGCVWPVIACLVLGWSVVARG